MGKKKKKKRQQPEIAEVKDKPVMCWICWYELKDKRYGFELAGGCVVPDKDLQDVYYPGPDLCDRHRKQVLGE